MNRFRLRNGFLLWAVLLSACCAGAAVPTRAEDFPSRPIHLIIPYGPGGIVDFTGRELAQKMSQNIGQPVVADNKPGAGGIVGVDFVAHADADGYNMVIMDPAIVINPTLQKSMPSPTQFPRSVGTNETDRLATP